MILCTLTDILLIVAFARFVHHGPDGRKPFKKI